MRSPAKPRLLMVIRVGVEDWGSTAAARDQTLFGIEAAACGFGFPYGHWPEGVGVLLAHEVG